MLGGVIQIRKKQTIPVYGGINMKVSQKTWKREEKRLSSKPAQTMKGCPSEMGLAGQESKEEEKPKGQTMQVSF